MSTAAPTGAPSAKEKKYDRQLRLWGANGQNRLEASHVALFGASAAGCEVLKNLILPGVGKFTIIDDQIVKEADLGTNFFLDVDSLEKSRAERTAALLAELNPEVEGRFINASLETLLEQRPELFDPATTPFTHLIVSTPFTSSAVLRLPTTVPVILVYSLGFMGCIRISAPTHCIVETHPESLIDLRLFSPWPELSAFASKHTQNIDTPESSGGMTNHLHGHVPYVALLLHYLEEWKSTHDNTLPSDYKQKNEFKSLVLSKMRTNVPGGSEENYEEAVSAVLKNLRTPEISPETKSILEDSRTLNPTAESSIFWILANALRSFIEDPNQGAGLLPLSGAVPDMKAESAVYVELQNIYRARAQRDAQLILKTSHSTLERLGREPLEITLDDVTIFAKHSNFLQRINYRPLSAQFSEQPDEFLKKAIIEGINGFSLDGEVMIYDAIAFRAWQAFLDKEGRAPGVEDTTLLDDLEKVMGLAKDFLEACGHIGEVVGTRTEKIVKELVRAGGREIHVLGALIGGMAAQEMTKIITKQYVPINNTMVFEGATSRSAVYEL